MLQSQFDRDGYSTPPSEEHFDDGGFDFDRILAIGRRRYKLIIACALFGLILGYGYVVNTIPIYTASSEVLVDSADSSAAQEFSGVTEVNIDSGAVDSQVQLLASETIALQVVGALGLTTDETFNRVRGTWLGGIVSDVQAVLSSVLDAFRSQAELEEPLETDPVQAAASKLRDNLEVSRVRRTYVLRISYTSPDKQLATRIANAYAEAIITDQLESKYEATRRASDWLLSRTEELQQQAIQAEKSAETFRNANNLIATSGSLISEQRLSGLNSEIITAKSAVSQIEARFGRLQSIVENGDLDAAVSEIVSQSITSDLRSRFLDASKKLSELVNLLGPNHAQAVRQRNEMFQLQRLMFEELKRGMNVARNDLTVAQERLKNLEIELLNLVSVSSETNQTLVQLKDLERNAETVRNLQTVFSQRYQESLQQQSFPIPDARIISRAKTPEFPSHPRRSRSLILALFLGGAFGAGLAALFELRDRVFRTGDQIRDELGLEFLGMVPIVAGANTPRRDRKPKSETQKPPLFDAEIVEPSPVADIVMASLGDVMSYSLKHPLSPFVETLRSGKVAADITMAEKSPKIIGIVSVLPNEGKSTISKNLASLIASQGPKTLLIDCDLRNPGLTRSCARDAEAGLLEVLTEQHPWQGYLVTEAETGLKFLPAVREHRVSHTSDLLASPMMRRLLDQAGQSFEYIIVDLPPLGPVVDVRAMLPLLDGVIFVVEWGKTNKGLVQSTIHSDARIYAKTLGVILNKVDRKKLLMYESYHSSSYYYSRYNKYYQSG